MGFGPAGLCASSLVRWCGNPIVVIERDPARAALARTFGFDTAASGTTADVVIECAGTPAAFAAGLEALNHGGTLIELGNAADLGSVGINPSAICLRDLRIVGSAETLYEDFPFAIRAVAETPVRLADAVSHSHQFDTLTTPSEPFEVAGVFKGVITFSEETRGDYA